MSDSDDRPVQPGRRPEDAPPGVTQPDQPTPDTPRSTPEETAPEAGGPGPVAGTPSVTTPPAGEPAPAAAPAAPDPAVSPAADPATTGSAAGAATTDPVTGVGTGAGADPTVGASPTSEEKQWALFAHLSALAGFIIPFGNVLGPLIIWQIKKNDMPFVDWHGKEALNFQITVTLAIFVCLLLMVVLIGALLLPVVGIAALVLTIIAAVKANNGERYRYPLTWRLIG